MRSLLVLVLLAAPAAADPPDAVSGVGAITAAWSPTMISQLGVISRDYTVGSGVGCLGRPYIPPADVANASPPPSAGGRLVPFVQHVQLLIGGGLLSGRGAAVAPRP
jgi:hypothetical protein